MQKAIDIVKAPPSDNLEEWKIWKNTILSRFISTSPFRKKIDILTISVTTKGEVSWGKDTNTGKWVAGASFGYE